MNTIIHSDFFNAIAQNYNARMQNVEKTIQTMPRYSCIKNEERQYLRISLYYLIKQGYHVYDIPEDDTTFYRLKEKQDIVTRADINEGTKSLRTLFKGYSFPINYPILFRLSIALSLTIEETYDWFRKSGIDLASDIPEFEALGYVIKQYCNSKNKTLSNSNILDIYYKADNYFHVQHGYKSLLGPSCRKK